MVEPASQVEISAVVEATWPGEPGPPALNSLAEYNCASLTHTHMPHTSTHYPFALSLTHTLSLTAILSAAILDLPVCLYLYIKKKTTVCCSKMVVTFYTPTKIYEISGCFSCTSIFGIFRLFKCSCLVSVRSSSFSCAHSLYIFLCVVSHHTFYPGLLGWLSFCYWVVGNFLNSEYQGFFFKYMLYEHVFPVCTLFFTFLMMFLKEILQFWWKLIHQWSLLWLSC